MSELDRQIDQMIADPDAYYAKAREEALREAIEADKRECRLRKYVRRSRHERGYWLLFRARD